MLRLLAAIGLFVLANGSQLSRCPSGHEQLLQRCLSMMRRQSGDLQQRCRFVNSGLDCIEDLINKCPEEDDISAMAGAINVDNMRQHITRECNGQPISTMRPVVTGNCRAGYMGRLQGCFQPIIEMNRDTGMDLAQKCRRLTAGLGCMDRVFTNCASMPEIQAASGMIDMDDMRTTLRKTCSSPPQIQQQQILKRGAGSCPRDYVNQMSACLAPLRKHHSSQKSERCRVGRAALTCFRNLAQRCSSVPSVQRNLSRLEGMSATLDRACSGY